MTVGNADPQALLAAFDKVDPARPRECPWLTPLLTILRELGPRAKPAAPALTKLLKQNLKDEELARAAMAALVKTESPDTKAVLLYVAEHGEGMLPEAALAAFARTDPSAAEDLVQLIEAGPSDVRRAAISGLRFTGRAAAPALLTRLEKGKPLRVRYDAINALTELQGQAKQAFPALAAVAKDSDEDAGLRIQATRALAAVDPAAAAGVYIELHKGRSRPPAANRKVGDAAMQCMRKLGSPATAALIRVVSTESGQAQAYAIKALAELGPAAKDALPVLEKCAASGNAMLRATALQAIRKIKGK